MLSCTCDGFKDSPKHSESSLNELLVDTIKGIGEVPSWASQISRVSTKRRPKTEDRRPKNEDPNFFARIRHGQLKNQAKAFLSANRCENNSSKNHVTFRLYWDARQGKTWHLWPPRVSNVFIPVTILFLSFSFLLRIDVWKIVFYFLGFSKFCPVSVTIAKVYRLWKCNLNP